METLREKFAGDHDSYVMLIFDVWKDSEHTDRTQVRLPYMNIEDVVKKYGDFIYSGWYTERWTDEEKAEFVEENWIYCRPSQYDCTGQIFTTRIDCFNMPRGVVVYIMEAMDV